MTKQERIIRNAVKAGTQACKKNGGNLSEEQLLNLKVQVMPDLVRWILFLGGVALIVFACIAWPSSNVITQIVGGCCGLLFILFSIIGIKRTLSVLDNLGVVGDLLGTVVDGIGSISIFD